MKKECIPVMGFRHSHIGINFNSKRIYIYMWRSKIWASDLGPGTTFHQQYARGEEITEDRCN